MVIHPMNNNIRNIFLQEILLLLLEHHNHYGGYMTLCESKHAKGATDFTFHEEMKEKH